MRKIDRFLGILLTIVGLLVLIFPATCVKIVTILLGLGAVAYGVFTIIDAKKLNIESEFFKKSVLIKSIAAICIGLLSVILPIAIASAAWKFIVYIFAIFLILSACLGFYSVSLVKDTLADRKRFIFENLSLLACGLLLLLISPQKLGIVIIRLIGCVALVAGIIMIIIQVISMKSKNNEIEVSPDSVVDDTEEEKTSE